MAELKNRYDFVMLFDVQDGNPNGDPDAGNLPRVDPQTGHGLVTDVCVKRKLRNYVMMSKVGATFDIFVKEKAVLNDLIEQGLMDAGVDLGAAKDLEGRKRKKPGQAQGAEVDKGRRKMCEKYFDVRTFGAVMSTGANAGQVRGAVQLTFSRSVDPIVPLEHSITRMAVATEEEAEKQGGENRTMGRKNTVPYGLYVGYGFVSPQIARQTGFSTEDLAIVWEALANMFEFDRSAARGFMSMRKVLAFRHESELGSAPAHRLFDLVKVKRKEGAAVPRRFEDYEISVGAPPIGVTIEAIV